MTNQAETESDRPTMFKVWVNSFIPGDISWLTKKVPAGPHKDETMIPGPTPVNDCFLTDQRDFVSDKTNVSSRMHSYFELQIIFGTPKLTQKHRCDPTVEVDCEDGDVECNKSASTNRMNFKLKNSAITGAKLEIEMECAANNPCFTGSPDIDIKGTFVIDFNAKKLRFDGKVEDFPAFEAYAIIDNGSINELFTLPPKQGSGPGDLIGDPQRAVNAEIAF